MESVDKEMRGKKGLISQEDVENRYLSVIVGDNVVFVDLI